MINIQNPICQAMLSLHSIKAKQIRCDQIIIIHIYLYNDITVNCVSYYFLGFEMFNKAVHSSVVGTCVLNSTAHDLIKLSPCQAHNINL